MSVYDPTQQFNEQLRALFHDTHPQEGPLVVVPHGKRFRRLIDHNYWKDFDVQETTDGMGTKGYFHWLMDTLEYGVQDAFAMPTGDNIEGGFIPIHLQSHLLIQQQDEEKILRIIKKLRDLCVENAWKTLDGRNYPIAITGGETAIMNTLQGFELGVTATGYVRKGEGVLPNIQVGDALLGLGSSGLHANGYSFYLDALNKRNVTLTNFLSELGEDFVKPTHVYLPAIKELLQHLREYIHGMVHITGNGFSKLRELMPTEDIDIEVGRTHSLKPQKLFWYGYEELGMSPQDMYRRLNNGVGFVVAIEQTKAEQALSILRKYFRSDVIGQAVKGRGRILIESEYQKETIIF